MKRPAAHTSSELSGVVPTFVDITDRVLYGEIWDRPELSKRDRSLITIASLISSHQHAQLPNHLKLGLANGLTVEQIGEAIAHLAFYAGWPTCVTASRMFLDATKELEAAEKA
jgi:4-carboxymuconolactone decarboxylase